jgi:hypothetical protein
MSRSMGIGETNKKGISRNRGCSSLQIFTLSVFITLMQQKKDEVWQILEVNDDLFFE